jgi:hypothetical protein
VSRVAANVGAGLGGALGGVVAASGLDGLIALFVANAVTYVLYVAILVVADMAPAALRGRYMAAIGLSWWLGLALRRSAGAP